MEFISHSEAETEALGEKLGLSRQAVSKWEADQAVPTMDNLMELSRLFGVPVDTLLRPDAPFPAPPAERREFPVEPDLMELRLNLPLRTGVSDDSDSYSQERPGYDFADTFQLRDYVPGDSAKQIHWKLSSKLDRLVVRDPGLPLERSVLLLWERRAESEAPQQASAMAEMVISLARELLRQGVRCCVAWNDAAGQDCALYELEDENDLYDMLPKLLSAPASSTLESVAELYLRQYGRANGKTVFVSAGGCPALERVCDPAELVGLFCAAELPQDFPGRGYCFSPDAEAALYEIDLY